MAKDQNNDKNIKKKASKKPKVKRAEKLKKHPWINEETSPREDRIIIRGAGTGTRPKKEED